MSREDLRLDGLTVHVGEDRGVRFNVERHDALQQRRRLAGELHGTARRLRLGLSAAEVGVARALHPPLPLLEVHVGPSEPCSFAGSHAGPKEHLEVDVEGWMHPFRRERAEGLVRAPYPAERPRPEPLENRVALSRRERIGFGLMLLLLPPAPPPARPN